MVEYVLYLFTFPFSMPIQKNATMMFKLWYQLLNSTLIEQLDVSWTKPDPFMPYEWMTQGLSNTNSAEDEDKNKGKDKEDGENDSDRENQNPNAQPVDEHVCVKPNPVSVRKLLEEIIELEKGYPDERPAHQIVHLDYGQPIMTEIRQPPPPPAPAMPGPLPPTQ